MFFIWVIKTIKIKIKSENWYEKHTEKGVSLLLIKFTLFFFFSFVEMGRASFLICEQLQVQCNSKLIGFFFLVVCQKDRLIDFKFNFRDCWQLGFGIKAKQHDCNCVHRHILSFVRLYVSRIEMTTKGDFIWSSFRVFFCCRWNYFLLSISLFFLSKPK